MSTDALFPPVLRFLKIQRVFVDREVQAGRHLGTLFSTPQLWRGTLAPASRELRNAAYYYQQRSRRVTTSFMVEVQKAVDRILEYPESTLLSDNYSCAHKGS